MADFDLIVVGGGIVGLATAREALTQSPDKRILLLEKEVGLALHQTGRNSGVMHSGIYYRPGSMRAENCRRGKQLLQEFCAAENIPFEICGKVIVAVSQAELPRLAKIHERGQANGVRCELIGAERLQELEPHAAGVQALHVPAAGIVDYPAVCARLGQHIQARGGRIVLSARVTAIDSTAQEVQIHSTQGTFTGAKVVTCGGLFADRLAKWSGLPDTDKIVPFRGEYFELRPTAQHVCRNLIYPVPDPQFPFLGVHFTRMIQGGVECGPNAVLAFAREGYRKRDISLRDLTETLTYPGFFKLAWKHLGTGLGEMWRSFSKRAFVKALQRLIPEIQADDLTPAPSGVRAQLVTRAGTVFDDWRINESERIINVLNAPSPAATAALQIGRIIVERLKW